MGQLLRTAALVGLVCLCCSSVSCGPGDASESSAVGSRKIRGAGATFPAPLYDEWIARYAKIRPEVEIEYEAVGSGAGIERFLAETVDFGASDAAMTGEQIADVARGAKRIPATAGSIVVAYNQPKIDGQLRLPRDVYVDIFRGKIRRWNDPRIRQANQQLDLPPDEIYLVVRSDSSGTTFAFTHHLRAVSPEKWDKQGPGTGKLVGWPSTAILAIGNEGVAGTIQRSPGTIGYVEYGIAERAGLAMASLENKAGNFVAPGGPGRLAALEESPLPDSLVAFFPDAEGEQSYPIFTYTWLLLYGNYRDLQKAADIQDFVKWCLQEGQTSAEPLGYTALPPEVTERALAAVDDIQSGASDER